MKLTREMIEVRLRLCVLNLCLATAAGKVGDIAEAKELLLDQVEKLVRETQKVAVTT